MQAEVGQIAQVFTIIAVFGTVMTIVGVTAARFLRKPKSVTSSDTVPVVSEARFARLEQAIDVIAVEVERIAEAQRFSAQLIAETLPDRLPAQGAKRREETRPRPGSTTPT
jgi:hypothetical protein